jgi:hypothetical protein
VKHLDRVFRGFKVCAVSFLFGVLIRGMIEVVRQWPKTTGFLALAIFTFYGLGLLTEVYLEWKNKS